MSFRKPVCLLAVTIAASSLLHAEEPATFNIRGVTAGLTREAELADNERWGKQLGKSKKQDGSTWLEYKFWAWQKVIAVVVSGVVQSVDTIPPDRLPAEQLAEALKLGKLTQVDAADSLPPAAKLGPKIPADWEIYRCSDAPGVLIFAQQEGPKLYAKWMRFYAEQSNLKPYLGLRIRRITAAEATQIGVDEPLGIFVEAVAPYSPSAEADIQAGDIILEISGERAENPTQFISLIHKHAIGTKQPLKIVRNGQRAFRIVTLKPRPEHLANFQMGAAFELGGQYRQAEAMFAKAVKLAPTEAIYLQKLAGCRRQLGLVKEALESANEAVRLDDKSASNYLERARCYLAVGQPENAMTDCQQAIRIEGNRPDAISTRGTVFARMGNLEKAVADFTQAIELDSKQTGAYVSRGGIYFQQEKYNQAIADYTTALKNDDRSFDAYYMRAWSYIKTGDNPSAEKDFQQLVTRLPNHDRLYVAYHGLGVALLNRRNFPAAVDAFSAAIKRNSRYGPSYQGRAKALQEMGKTQEANADLQLARQFTTKSAASKPSTKLVTVLADTFDGRAANSGRPLFGSQQMTWETGDKTGKLTALVTGVLPVMYARPNLKDFIAEFEVAAPADKCDYGIVFRSDDLAEGLDFYYMLTISTDATVRLACWRYPEWKVNKSAEIAAGLLSDTNPNRFRVEVSGQKFRVYVNGTAVADFEDATLTQPGPVGLCISAEPNATVVFRSFRVLQTQSTAKAGSSAGKNAGRSSKPPPAPVPQ